MTLNLNRSSNTYLREIDFVKDNVIINNNEINDIKDNIINILNEIEYVNNTLNNHEDKILSFDDITKRTPYNTDYNELHKFWRNENDIWEAIEMDDVNKKTAWIKQKTAVPIIQNLNAVQGCYWTKLIYPGYISHCINVSINDELGPGENIGFQADGELDIIKLNAYLGDNYGTINIWYDQSPNEYHLTSAGINRPVIRRTKDISNTYGIVFYYSNSPSVNPLTQPPVALISKHLIIPAGLTVQSNNFTITTLCGVAASNSTCPIVSLYGAATSFGIGYKSGTSWDSIVASFKPNLIMPSPIPDLAEDRDDVRLLTNYQPLVGGQIITCSSSNIGLNGVKVISNDGEKYITGNSIAANNIATLAGGMIGADIRNMFGTFGNISINGGSIIGGLIISNIPYTENNLIDLYRGFISTNQIFPQIRNTICFDGDSITYGLNQNVIDFNKMQFYNIPTIVYNTLEYKFRVYNFGKSSTIFEGQRISALRWLPDVYNKDSPLNIIVVCLGTNDINGGQTAIQVYNNMILYVEQAKLAGFYVIVGTIYPRRIFLTTPAFEEHRLEYNEMLRDNKEILGIEIIDYAREYTMGNTENTINPSLYYPDGTHPSSLGYEILGNFCATELKRILKL